MSQESPAYNTILKAIISNSNVSNKEQIIAEMTQAAQPSPEVQQMQAQQQQMQMQDAQLTLAEKEARVQKLNAEAQKTAIETQMIPQEMQLKAVQAASTNLNPQTTDDFEKRLKLADLMLKEEDIRSNERIAMTQMTRKQA